MLAHLLQQQGFEAQNASAKLAAGELVKMVDEADGDAVCISVVAPSTVIHARYLCGKLRAQLPNLKIVVGLWGATENITQAAQRLRDSGANEVHTTFAAAVVQLPELAPRAAKDSGLSAIAELKPTPTRFPNSSRGIPKLPGDLHRPAASFAAERRPER